MENNSKTHTNQELSSSEIVNHVCKKFWENIINEISSAIQQLLESKNPKINFAEDMNTKESINEVINDYIEKIAPTISEFSWEIAIIIKDRISKKIEQKEEKQRK